MSGSLQVFQPPDFDEVITKHQFHTYLPRNDHFNLNDEISITINNEDIYTATYESYLYLSGTLTTSTSGDGEVRFTNNPFGFMFEQLKYTLNGVLIDEVRNPGITSTLKSYISFNDNESKRLAVGGWDPFANTIQSTFGTHFSACIPLKFFLGFFEDYKKLILGARQELILLRSKTDDNCYISTGTKTATVKIDKIEWKVPHVSVEDNLKYKYLKALDKNKSIYITFRQWELHELPSLRNNTRDVWPIKTSTNLQKPRYAVIAFQNKRRDLPTADGSKFDHSSITNLKLHLNSWQWPYDSMNLNFALKQYGVAYYMYSSFQNSYYNRNNEPLLDYSKFHDCPIFVIDCSKQDESVKSLTCDVKLELESSHVFDKDTCAYALLIHDVIFEYFPLEGSVRKVI
jgi:hypothetical protein